MIRGHAAGTFVASIYNNHLATLKAGSHADAEMQSEYKRLGGRGLLCRVIETPARQ